MDSIGIHFVDILIIVLYLAFISWMGFTASSGHKSADDFFLASRSLTWPIIGMSLFASNISTSSLIGLSSSGYKTGISVFNYEWTGSVLMVLFAISIVPYYLNNKLTTMPEYLERRYDGRSRFYFSVISVLANVIIDISAALYASSIVLKAVFPDVDSSIFITIMAVISGLYTVAGGLKAVVVTDSIQTVLLTIGTASIAILLYQEVGPWSNIVASIEPQYLSLIRPADDATIPWPTLFISLPILGFYFLCANQHIVQRVLGAKSVDEGRKGAVFAGFLKLLLLFIIVLPGTASQLLYPELRESNLVFPNLMFDLLPVGLFGIVLMGFIAALMSSIDSALTAAATISTMDIYKKFNPESSDKQLIRIGRILIMVFVLLASVWTPFIKNFPTLWEYLQAALAYLIPPVVTCFLFGLFWRKSSPDGAFYALISGNILGIFIILNNNLFLLWGDIHYLYAATIIFLFSSIVLVFFSYLSPQEKNTIYIPHPKFINATRIEQTRKKDMPWYSDYRFYATLLCLCIASLVWYFW